MYLDTSRNVVAFLCCFVAFGSWEKHKGGVSGAFVTCLLLAQAPAFAENFKLSSFCDSLTLHSVYMAFDNFQPVLQLGANASLVWI